MKQKNPLAPVFTIYTGVSGRRITMQGDMFKYRTDAGLYLSSNSFDGTQKYYDLYSTVKSISSNNPPFSAYPLNNYDVSSNNVLSFEMPVRTRAEKLDIIYANPAGYIRASQMDRFTFIQVLTSRIVQNVPLP